MVSVEEAISYLFSVWKSGINEPEVLYKIAENYYLINDNNKAVQFCELALKFDPSNVKYSYMLGVSLLALGSKEAARQAFDLPGKGRSYLADIELAKLTIDDQEAGFGWPYAQSALSKNQTIPTLITAIEHCIDSLKKPGAFRTGNIQVLQRYLKKLKDADTISYQKLNAEFLFKIGEFSESVKFFKMYFEACDTTKPTEYYNYSHALLSSGAYQEGLSELYQTSCVNNDQGRNDRFAESKGLKKIQPSNLKEIKNQTVVVVSEQGMGDQLWGLGYVDAFASRYECSVELWLPPKLAIKVRGDFNDSVEVFSLPETDLKDHRDKQWYTSTMFLFYLLKSDDREFSCDNRTLMKPQAFNVSKLRSKYVTAKSKAIVGLSWRSEGSPFSATKKIPYNFFSFLKEIPDLQCISCQYHATDDDQNGFAQQNISLQIDDEIDNYNSMLDAFDQVAACDFIITNAGVVAHIAGALGKPAVVLVNIPSVWYWNSPDANLWYPTVSVISKTSFEPWENLTSKVEEFVFEQLAQLKMGGMDSSS